MDYPVKLKSEESIDDDMERLSLDMDDTEFGHRSLPFKRKAELMRGSDSESVSDKDIIMTRPSTNKNREPEMLEDSQFKKQEHVAFLKQYFDQLRTYKPMCNWLERYGDIATSKPPQLEDFPCQCNLENKSSKKDKRPLAKKMNSIDNSDESKSESDPLAAHNVTCNFNRLNEYFTRIARYICKDTLDENVFRFDPDSSEYYENKKTRLMRKSVILMMRDSQDEFLEDWSDLMSEQETEEWKNRNKVREYVCFILKSMLENMIGPSPPESSDDEADDSLNDNEKAEYRDLKEIYEDFEDFIDQQVKLRKLQMQNIALANRLKEMRKRMNLFETDLYSYRTVNEDSESGSESRSTESEESDINMENTEWN